MTDERASSEIAGSGVPVRIRVFIQNEAGKAIKNFHDEKTLEFKGSKPVAYAYPFPSGFILGTDGHDGCNVDCFVLTRQRLATGTIVECEPIGLMEQYEDGVEDFNVLARLPGERVSVTPEVAAALRSHILAMYRDVAGKEMEVGDFVGAEAAGAYIVAHLERG